MAIRVIAVFDVGVPPYQREQLPESLTEALKARSSELETLGLKPAELDRSRWIWCHRAVQNQPPIRDSKPSTLR